MQYWRMMSAACRLNCHSGLRWTPFHFSTANVVAGGACTCAHTIVTAAALRPCRPCPSSLRRPAPQHISRAAGEGAHATKEECGFGPAPRGPATRIVCHTVPRLMKAEDHRVGASHGGPTKGGGGVHHNRFLLGGGGSGHGTLAKRGPPYDDYHVMAGQVQSSCHALHRSIDGADPTIQQIGANGWGMGPDLGGGGGAADAPPPPGPAQ